MNFWIPGDSFCILIGYCRAAQSRPRDSKYPADQFYSFGKPTRSLNRLSKDSKVSLHDTIVIVPLHVAMIQPDTLIFKASLITELGFLFVSVRITGTNLLYWDAINGRVSAVRGVWCASRIKSPNQTGLPGRVSSPTSYMTRPIRGRGEGQNSARGVSSGY